MFGLSRNKGAKEYVDIIQEAFQSPEKAESVLAAFKEGNNYTHIHDGESNALNFLIMIVEKLEKNKDIIGRTDKIIELRK